jgi:hypothetical protein
VKNQKSDVALNVILRVLGSILSVLAALVGVLQILKTFL